MSDYDYEDPEETQRREAAEDEWIKSGGDKKMKRKIELAKALRLADAAVIEAARIWKAAWHDQRYYPREYEKAREALADAVSAYDKALAEQAKEASRG